MRKEYFVVRDLESDIALAYGWLSEEGYVVQFDDSAYLYNSDTEWLDFPESLLDEEKENIVYPT